MIPVRMAFVLLCVGHDTSVTGDGVTTVRNVSLRLSSEDSDARLLKRIHRRRIYSISSTTMNDEKRYHLLISYLLVACYSLLATACKFRF